MLTPVEWCATENQSDRKELNFGAMEGARTLCFCHGGCSRGSRRALRVPLWYGVKYGGLVLIAAALVAVAFMRDGWEESMLREPEAFDSASARLEVFRRRDSASGWGNSNSSSSSSNSSSSSSNSSSYSVSSSSSGNFSNSSSSSGPNTDCDQVSKLKHGRCQFAKDNCADEGYLNYEMIHYCMHMPYLSFPLFVCWLLVLFYLLNLAAEDFFCPSLTRFSKILHMNANIAGVTLLAFGNGAPDIFSVLAGVGQGDFGIAVGEITGAGNFVTEVVVGAVCLIASGGVKLPRRPFLRDCGFFLVSAVVLFAIIWDGRIYLFESIALIVYYIIFVVVVIGSRIIYQTMKRRKRRRVPPRSLSVQISDDVEGFGPLSADLTSLVAADLFLNDGEGGGQAPVGSEVFDTAILSGADVNTDDEEEESNYGDEKTPLLFVDSEDEDKSKLAERRQFDRWAKDQLKAMWMKFYDQFSELSIPFKVIYIIFLPARAAFNLTIPFTDYDKYNKPLAIMYCFTSPMFLLYVTGYFLLTLFWHIQLWMVILVLCCVAGVFVLITAPWSRPPFYRGLFIFASFVLSAGWIYAIANELVNLLQALGIFLHISTTILGITLLAWGNSIGDLVADTVVARHGFPEMGMTACYCAPMVNMLVGLGLGVTLKIVHDGRSFSASIEHSAFVAFFFMIFSLVYDFVFISVLCRWVPGRKFGLTKLLIYFVFSVFTFLVEFKVINW